MRLELGYSCFLLSPAPWAHNIHFGKTCFNELCISNTYCRRLFASLEVSLHSRKFLFWFGAFLIV